MQPRSMPHEEAANRQLFRSRGSQGQLGPGAPQQQSILGPCPPLHSPSHKPPSGRARASSRKLGHDSDVLQTPTAAPPQGQATASSRDRRHDPDAQQTPLGTLVQGRAASEEGQQQPSEMKSCVLTVELLTQEEGSKLASAPDSVAFAILGMCSWGNRAALMGLNKHWRDDIFGNDSSWKAMCSFLHCEHYIYSGPECISSSWRTLFAELWLLRSRWSKSQEPTESKVVYTVAEKLRRERAGETDLTVEPAWKKPLEAHSFNMKVVVRLRPQSDCDGAASMSEAKDVILPLHQRIACIQQQKGCSREKAFEELFRGDDTLVEKTDTTRSATAGVVSVGPKEIVMCAPGIGLRPFRCFDSVLCDKASQATVFETVARRQVADFVNGLNCTIFCYGQTGSGKTHTLFGKDTDSATGLASISADAGLVPRVCAEIAAAVAQRQRFMDECTLQLSYVEVFGEDVSDLLKGDQKSVGAWKGTAVRAVLDGCMRVIVNSMEHMESLLQRGEAAKRYAATAMNGRSSRAHSLLILTLTQTVGSIKAVSNLCLADLGGSEQLTKSGATGERMHEAIGINKGLLALKQCIRALNNNLKHVPYHDSKLTELLSSGLGGNSKTAVVVTASLEPRHASESLQSLRFGEACAAVTNVADVQQSSVAHLIAELDAQIASTEALIEKNERWERWEEQMPVDNFGDGGGIRTRMKLVGAEREREFLESCLKKRRALLGEPEPDEKEMEHKKIDAEATALGKPYFEKPGTGDADVIEVESAFNHRSDVPCTSCNSIPAVADGAEQEAKEESLIENKACLMEETLGNKENAGLGKEEQMREERRALACAKAAEREAQAAKRKEELLAVKMEKVRKQQEKVARQQKLRRAQDQNGSHLETALLSVEAELAEAVRDSGIESERSIELAAKAEDFRQQLKAHKVAKARSGYADAAAIFSRKSLLHSEEGQAQAIDGWQADMAAAPAAAPVLSAEERELIAEHLRGRLIKSHQATDW